MENMKTMHAMKGSYRSFAIELVLDFLARLTLRRCDRGTCLGDGL